MDNLRKINDVNYIPTKGDSVNLDNRYGVLLNDDFTEILWTDNNETVEWVGGWESFIQQGGFILVI